MGGLIRLLALRAAPYLVRVFWPSCASAVLIWLAIGVGRDAISAEMDREMALVSLAGIALGLASCLIWAVGSIRDYRRAEAPQPHL
jgi:hypothetical protein